MPSHRRRKSAHHHLFAYVAASIVVVIVAAVGVMLATQQSALGPAAGDVGPSGELAATDPATVVVGNPVPGRTTTLTYTGVISRAGVLASVRMQLPSGARGAVTSPNGTLTTSGGFATWVPRKPIKVTVGTPLSIPVHGVVLAKKGGVMTLAMSARTANGTILANGSARLTLVAPPATMPTVPVRPSAPVPGGCPTKWPSTNVENAKPGTNAWVIPKAMDGELAAYLSKVSAACGESVDLKVSSGKPVSVIAYRMGYYQGLGAREVWRREGVPTVVQPAPVIKDKVWMATAAHWSKTLSIAINRDWVPGTYLLKISDGTSASYVPLTVRDDTGTKHDLLIQQATTSWEAYNGFGGRSFYSGEKTGSSRITSNRPYSEGQGSGQFLKLEQGLVFWAESKGLDVTYWTNHDLDRFGGQLPARARTIFLPAHDEYYSPAMRAALASAMNKGVNVANLGANTVFRLIKFTDGSKRTWNIDKSEGFASTTWRHLGDAYSSQALLGAEYVCPLKGNTLTTGTNWLFKGIPAGTRLPGFLAGEIDYVQPELYQHPELNIVASGTGTCNGNGKVVPMHATTITMSSGARVFNGSTFAYACFLISRCPHNWAVPNPPVASRQAVATMVANITEWVSRGQIRVPGGSTVAPLNAAVPR